MGQREKLITGEYYHIFNRGVEKRKIFNNRNDYLRFLKLVIFLNTEKSGWEVRNLRKYGNEALPQSSERLVDIVSYCLNSNHFHFILKGNSEEGISTFMKKICTGYAMYFNKKYNRSGVLFQGRFKSSHIISNDLLLYISAYVNCNSQIHGIEDAFKYQWCSFSEYIKGGGICQKDIITNQFKSLDEYESFCFDKIIGMKERKDAEKIHLE